MDGLTPGRIVHYVLTRYDVPDHNAGEHRAALVVRVWNEPQFGGAGIANLMVFLDGDNDQAPPLDSRGPERQWVLWRTSAHYSEAHEPGTWHWIERD